MICCVKPQISRLSEFKYEMDGNGRYERIQHTNRICLNCNAHWYGPGEGRFYTGKEWDAWINEAFAETKWQGKLFA